MHLEHVLSAFGFPFQRIGIAAESGVPILKPHGSIDWRAPRSIFRFEDRIRLIDIQTSIEAMPYAELLYQRCDAQLVLPNEPSTITGRLAIKRGYEVVAAMAPECTHCVIAGISYWECDRQEIDYLIDQLSPKVCVVIANPCPPEDMLDRLADLKLRVVVCPSAPDLDGL